MKIARCPTCKRRMTRSNPANARYWALLHLLSEKLQKGAYSAEQWHLWARSKFLGCEDFILPNGKPLSIPKSTAVLDVAEFGEFMTAVEAWANEHNCWLEDKELGF